MFDLFDLEPVDYDPFAPEVADKRLGGAPQTTRAARDDELNRLFPARPENPMALALGYGTEAFNHAQLESAIRRQGMGTTQPNWWLLPQGRWNDPRITQAEGEPSGQVDHTDSGWGVANPPANALNLWDKFERVPQQVRSGVVPPAEIFVDPKTKKRWLMQVKNTGTDI